MAAKKKTKKKQLQLWIVGVDFDKGSEDYHYSKVDFQFFAYKTKQGALAFYNRVQEELPRCAVIISPHAVKLKSPAVLNGL